MVFPVRSVFNPLIGFNLLKYRALQLEFVAWRVGESPRNLKALWSLDAGFFALTLAKRRVWT
ncbi:MAG: hypothetical protein CMK32_14910 [Porticoccaceae bacterium]|nr:hypothetical protein [Porticoccaceae bacterium]